MLKLSLEKSRMRFGEKLEEAYTPIRDELAQVESDLKVCQPEDFGVIGESVGFVLASLGKRIRPALVILSARACGLNGSSGAIQMAAAAELFHTATLVTDDILDAAGTRRGRETINHRWGTEAAVLSAQYLYLSALTLTSKINVNGKSRDFSRLMLETAREMLSGEVNELERGESVRPLTEKEYLRVVRAKTASLFSACTRAGAMLADADKDLLGAMLSFGENLGIAFQITDDVLDLTADEEMLGKPVGADQRMGRMTLPLIHHLSVLDKKERRELLSSKVGRDDIEELRFLLERSGSIDYSLRKARQYAALAQNAIGSLAESVYKTSLVALSVYAVERDM